MKITFLWTHPVEFNRVLMRYQGVLLTVEEKDGALRLRYQVNIAEAFVDDHREEAGPAE